MARMTPETRELLARRAFYAILAVLFIWGLYGSLKGLHRSILAHDRLMIHVGTQGAQEARYDFLRECVKKNPLKACAAVKGAP